MEVMEKERKGKDKTRVKGLKQGRQEEERRKTNILKVKE